MATRQVVDCDRCKKKAIKGHVTLDLVTGHSWDLGDARNRPDWMRVQLCSKCCEAILKAILRKETGSAGETVLSLNDEIVTALRYPTVKHPERKSDEGMPWLD